MPKKNYLYNKQKKFKKSKRKKIIHNPLSDNQNEYEDYFYIIDEAKSNKYLLIKLIVICLIVFILIHSYYDIFFSGNSKKIKVAFYNFSYRYGGIERVTSILFNYFSKEKKFTFYLITWSDILEGEYALPNGIKRISLSEQKIDIFSIIKNEQIDILINNCDIIYEIEEFNKLNSTKVIHCTHSSFFYRIYLGFYNIEDTVYQSYKGSKYVLALIPLENDYLFKKWGINSLLMENPVTFEYDSIIPSDLSKKNLIMIGRGDFPGKRFDLGITSMKYIVKEIPESKMYIVSPIDSNLTKSIQDLQLENNVLITGFQTDLTPYLKNSSLHIFPSLNEAYPMVLGEVKIYGIPSILCGLDYIILSKGGTVIIYDDDPNTIGEEAIKILKDDEYRKKLGKEARESMKKHRNKLIIKKWKKLLVSVYNGIDELSFSKLFTKYHLNEKEAKIILNNQLNLIKKRIPDLKNLTLEKLEAFQLNKSDYFL